jgi:hypothetical protein
MAEIEVARRAMWSSRWNRFVVVAEIPAGRFCLGDGAQPTLFDDFETARAAAASAPLDAFWSLPV